MKKETRKNLSLNEYLETHGIKIQVFAKKVGISRNHLSQLLKRQVLPRLELAHLIEKETDGAVTLYSWFLKN